MTAQPRIEILLEEVIKKKASDLHIQVGLPPMLRVDGALIPVSGAEALTEEAVEGLVFAILDEDQKQILLKDKEEVVEAIKPDFIQPDSRYFNADAVNPTQLIQIGNNPNPVPFKSANN